MLSDRDFVEKFNIRDEKWANIFIKFLNNNSTKNINDLKMKIDLGNHVEFNIVDIIISSMLPFDNITDGLITNMLVKVENRILKITGPQAFIIMHRAMDNRIFKSAITEVNE